MTTIANRVTAVLSSSLLVLSVTAAPVALHAQAPPPAASAKQKPDAPKGAAPAGAARVVNIEGSDLMKYSVTSITAKPGEQIRVRLTSKGTMPKIAMAHNFVLLKLKADATAFANAGATARATDFIPPALKDQVLAATGLAGNGETVEVTFKVPAARGSYPFVCTFPGHAAAGMKGMLVVK